MKALVIKTARIVLATILLVADQLASVQMEANSNICKAGIADGTWPVWIWMFLVLLLAMYAKVAIAEE
ncbi:MAG: hypothetical protein AAGC88_12730 [Bacteroidota bacterium]